MAEKITTLHSAKIELEKAQADLKQAKDRGFKGKDLEGYNRNVKAAKTKIAAIEKALKASEKGKK